MNNKTTFIRVEKDKNYSVIHNQFLRKKDLSWKAKGILAYILMLPDDWNINLKEIMTHATEGEAAFRSGWKELKESGYVNRYPVKDKDTKRILHWETVVSETSQKPHVDFPDVANPNVGNPDVANRNLQSTDRTKDLSKQSTDNTKTPSPTKHKHGDAKNVLLTDDELEKLKDEFSDYEDRINNLSYYIGSKGAKYKSHYMTILAWARKDKKQSSKPQETNNVDNILNDIIGGD